MACHTTYINDLLCLPLVYCLHPDIYEVIYGKDSVTKRAIGVKSICNVHIRSKCRAYLTSKSGAKALRTIIIVE